MFFILSSKIRWTLNILIFVQETSRTFSPGRQSHDLPLHCRILHSVVEAVHPATRRFRLPPTLGYLALGLTGNHLPAAVPRKIQVAGNSLLPSDWNSPGTSCFHWNGNGNLIRNISLPSHSLGHKRTNFIISIKHFLGWNLRNFLPKGLVKIKYVTKFLR